MDRKKKIRIKNRLIIGSVYLAIIVFIVSALFIDSASWIPTIVCGVSEAWMAFIFVANLPKKGEKKHGKISSQKDAA